LFQIMDYYSASGMSMLFLVFFQTISINWIFGGNKFCEAVEQMLGKKPSRFLYICWVFLAPAVMLVIHPSKNNSICEPPKSKLIIYLLLSVIQAIFVFSIVQYTPVTYGKGYQYPTWAEALGICISLSSMLWIPIYAVYYICTTPGTLREVCSF
jgi:solute carrier family 6 GABA transporter-like protein 1